MDMSEELRLQQGDVPAAVRKKDILLKGKPAKVDSISINGKEIVISGGLLRTAKLLDEWYEDVEDPKAMLESINKSNLKADLFTFWQRLPETTPKYSYYMEWDNIAVLPIHDYNHWWDNKIKSRTRTIIKSAEKKGVVTREDSFDDKFVLGMTEIFNETPVRQGRPFWHFGKDFQTVKTEFSRFLHRESLIGSYLEDKMLGFMMMADAGRYALIGQIISKLAHRDKSINNLLIAKSIELCSKRSIPYLVYLSWDNGSLTEFKRRNGFEKIGLPRYYIPLTRTGEVSLKLGLHRGLKGAAPAWLMEYAKEIRARWYEK
jgi:hypothetical protein